MQTPRPEPGLVAEIQGLYGPFTFPEYLLQRIWSEGAFERGAAVMTDGRRVRVLHPGRWNRLGPDFKGAKLQFGEDETLVGDVELHLRAEDWQAHGHAADRAYDGVVLHVVLFPPRAGSTTKGAGGRAIPVLALLPLLHHDLEEYAAENAVERLAGRPAARVTEELSLLPPEELRRVLATHAERRWAQKVHFARLRVQRLGWEAACHHTALEIMGYRFNRAPMLRIAGQWPLAAWRTAGADVAEMFTSEAAGWRLQGSRPANHPRARLKQYAAWVAARPQWPERLIALAAELPTVAAELTTGEARRRHGFTTLRRRVGDEICGGAVGGTRLDNLVCDGFLPLLATGGVAEAGGCWLHWFPGDLPPMVPRALRTLGVFSGRAAPANHGAAQGLLGWMIDAEDRSRAGAGRGA